MAQPTTPSIRPADVVAFVCEIAMLILLVVAAWGIAAGTAARLALAVGFVVVAIAIWSVWMAPRSGRRLPPRARLAAQVLLFAVVAALLTAAGHLWWGVGFAVVSSAAFAATGRT